MSPVVYIGTVLWRFENLCALVQALDVPENDDVLVVVFCDGYGIAAPDFKTEYVNVLVLNDGGRHGAGRRWRSVAATADSVLAIVIDDDLKVDPGYVARCTATYARLKTPFSWNGTLFNGAYVPPEASPHADQPLFIMGAGTAVIPTALLKGITEDPLADEYLGVNGDDEALVSWWLARQGVTFVRPAGPSGASSTAFQWDKRSQWASAGGRHFGFRRRLKERGWPGAPETTKEPVFDAPKKLPVISTPRARQHRFKR